MNTEFENPTFPRLDRKENARIYKKKTYLAKNG
jgi:hypothetical protein